jgi:signal transduction histidine kinase
MAAGIAHEINNPLEGMANYLAIADQDLQDGDVDAARTDLGRVREGLERVAGIVRRVLRLASPGRGHGELVDLNEIVTSAGELARGTPSGKGRTVIIRTASAAPRVPGDPTTLGQLVLNLLVNAMEADTNGRDVEVETRETEQHLEVRVSDRGPGLPAGERERLFEPFWSTKGSTGLGLAISHGIALEHGGTLRAEDRPGGGAVFVLTIPRAPKSDGPRAAIRNEASP